MSEQFEQLKETVLNVIDVHRTAGDEQMAEAAEIFYEVVQQVGVVPVPPRCIGCGNAVVFGAN